jgi:hypothetical protein
LPVRIGVVTDPSASCFSSIAYTITLFSLEIPSGEEPRLRSFLAEAARDAGRGLEAVIANQIPEDLRHDS